MFGAKELGARLPLALAAIGALMAVYWAGRSLLRKRAALLAMLALGTMPLFVLEARQLNSDAPLIATLALALGGLGPLCVAARRQAARARPADRARRPGPGHLGRRLPAGLRPARAVDRAGADHRPRASPHRRRRRRRRHRTARRPGHRARPTGGPIAGRLDADPTRARVLGDRRPGRGGGGRAGDRADRPHRREIQHVPGRRTARGGADAHVRLPGAPARLRPVPVERGRDLRARAPADPPGRRRPRDQHAAGVRAALPAGDRRARVRAIGLPRRRGRRRPLRRAPRHRAGAGRVPGRSARRQRGRAGGRPGDGGRDDGRRPRLLPGARGDRVDPRPRQGQMAVQRVTRPAVPAGRADRRGGDLRRARGAHLRRRQDADPGPAARRARSGVSSASA